MAQRTSWSAGQVLAQAEGSIGTTVRTAVADYYKGKDMGTAQTIREAATVTDAAKLVTAMRQGRVHEILLVSASAVAGAVAGVLSQKAVDNASVKGVPVVSVLGAIPAVAGLAVPISLSGRSTLTVGGLTYITGAVLYRMLTKQAEAQPEGGAP